MLNIDNIDNFAKEFENELRKKEDLASVFQNAMRYLYKGNITWYDFTNRFRKIIYNLVEYDLILYQTAANIFRIIGLYDNYPKCIAINDKDEITIIHENNKIDKFGYIDFMEYIIYQIADDMKFRLQSVGYGYSAIFSVLQKYIYIQDGVIAALPPYKCLGDVLSIPPYIYYTDNSVEDGSYTLMRIIKKTDTDNEKSNYLRSKIVNTKYPELYYDKGRNLILFNSDDGKYGKYDIKNNLVSYYEGNVIALSENGNRIIIKKNNRIMFHDYNCNNIRRLNKTSGLIMTNQGNFLEWHSNSQSAGLHDSIRIYFDNNSERYSKKLNNLYIWLSIISNLYTFNFCTLKKISHIICYYKACRQPSTLSVSKIRDRMKEIENMITSGNINLNTNNNCYANFLMLLNKYENIMGNDADLTKELSNTDFGCINFGVTNDFTIINNIFGNSIIENTLLDISNGQKRIEEEGSNIEMNKIKSQPEENHETALKDVIITSIGNDNKEQAASIIKNVCKLTKSEIKVIIDKAKKRSYTFHALDKKKANRLAHDLRKTGVKVIVEDCITEWQPFM